MTLTPPLVDCMIDDPRWDAAGLPRWAEASARAALHGAGCASEGFEISLLGCDDARIAALNGRFRDKTVPTNVLSWPTQDRGAMRPGLAPAIPNPGAPEAPEALGDIALAYETCLREARAAEVTLEAHGRHLVVHGVLHLLGYDHETDADAALMERLEVEVLASMGIANPYAPSTLYPDHDATPDKSERCDG